MKVKDINSKLNLKNHNDTKSKFSMTATKILKSRYAGYAVLAIAIILIILLNQAGIVKRSTLSAITKILVYFIAVLGFNLLMGYSGLSSLGTAGFIGIGAYITGILVGQHKLPLILALALVIVASILLGTIVGFVSLRIEGIYLAIVTLGLSEILARLFTELAEITKGDEGINFLAETLRPIAGVIPHTTTISIVLVLIMVIFLMFITTNIMTSPLGRAFLSMKNSTSAAQAMGIGLLKHRLLAFVISTVFAGISGLFYAAYFRSVQPQLWDIMLSLNILAAVVIGGSKSVWASFGGTVLIFGLQPLLLDNLGIDEKLNIPNIINGVLIVLIVMFFNGGLIQMFNIAKKRIDARLEKRKEEKWRNRYGSQSYYNQTPEDFIIAQHQRVK